MKGSIQKRGKTYTYRTDGPKDPITGKRNQISKGGFKRRKDADVALRKLLSELDENRYAEPSNETLADYLNFWFSTHYQKRVKETTVASRRYMMQKICLLNVLNGFALKILHLLNSCMKMV